MGLLELLVLALFLRVCEHCPGFLMPPDMSHVQRQGMPAAQSSCNLL